MVKWFCEVCGYVYYPELGAENVPPGTSFEELPGDWYARNAMPKGVALTWRH